MDTNETLSVKGEVTLEHFGPDGELKQRIVAPNLIVTTGLEGIIDQLLASPSVSKPGYLAVGTGSTAAANGDTALGTEVKRKAFAEKTRSGKTVTMKAEFAKGEATGALREAGLLTASSGGTLYSRIVFEALTIGAEDTLTVTWKYTQS